MDDQRTEHLEYLTSWRSDGAHHFPLICFSAADIVEGMVNKGIFLNGDNGGTFLHFGNYQNSCISDPTMCGPEGEHAVCSCYNLADFLVLTPDFFFFRDYLLFLLEKPRGRVSFRCSLRRKSYLQRLLRLHQHLRRVRGVLHSRQQLQMEGQNRSRSRYCEWMNISQALMRNVFWFIYKCIFLFSTINC